MKKSATPLAINESSRFDTPAETFGWTGEGQIHLDKYDDQNRWFSTWAKKVWGKALTGLEDVEVSIRLRGEHANETLIATHPGGTETLDNLSAERPSLYRFFIRSTVIGEVWVSFKLTSNRKMVIDTINVRAPVQKNTLEHPHAPEALCTAQTWRAKTLLRRRLFLGT
ncbi:hypothetical protein I5R92_16765 [Pseudomonas carnis]|uniref:hypothetical protein n=1 Tax=Pseudomonas carnis TaxID=2487355 RepID=UPI0018DA2F37|nr:hypothetical protein [Pseudomonas carnis]MBH3368942.1 hypothetical protein [Pseudomonas carnis]